MVTGKHSNGKQQSKRALHSSNRTSNRGSSRKRSKRTSSNNDKNTRKEKQYRLALHVMSTKTKKADIGGKIVNHPFIADKVFTMRTTFDKIMKYINDINSDPDSAFRTSFKEFPEFDTNINIIAFQKDPSCDDGNIGSLKTMLKKRAHVHITNDLYDTKNFDKWKIFASTSLRRESFVSDDPIQPSINNMNTEH
jgi:hypothetical protein